MYALWTEFDRWGSFPETVNEYAARCLALEVALLALAGFLFSWPWMAPLLALGFFLRVWAGPRFDPMAQAAVGMAKGIVGRKEVPGPPKRFAQLMGFILMTLGSLALLFNLDSITLGALLVLFLLASLESLAGVCMGCKIFAGMMRLGWIPESICRRCGDWRGA